MEENPTAQSQENPQEAPTGIPHSKRLFMLLGILAVFILAVGVVIGYKFSQKPVQPTPTPEAVATPTPDPTANWETYTNAKYGFSFKHPNLDDSCCNISGPVTGSPQKIVILADKSTVTQGTDAPFNGLAIYVEPNQNNMSFATYLSSQKQDLIKNYKIMTDKEPIQTNDEQIRVGMENGVILKGYAWWATLIYLPLKNSGFLIIAKTQESSGSFDETFDQIISTFKFLDETEKGDTLGWKTYTNIDFGFKIQHPESLSISKELNDQYNRGIWLGDGSINISISLRKAEGIDLKNYYYLDNPIKSSTVVDGETANIYESVTGYCDGPTCGAPFIAYVIKKNNDLYIISFSGDTKLSDIESQILSTFKFLE